MGTHTEFAVVSPRSRCSHPADPKVFGRRIQESELKPDRSLISTNFGRAGTNLSPATKKIESPNLPSPLTTLLGQHCGLNDPQHLITASRLTTITGSGGIRKTRF